jgi:hypothetical protein
MDTHLGLISWRIIQIESQMLHALGPLLGGVAGQHQADTDLMKVVDNLKEMWRCWSIVHSAVSKPDRDVDRLANAIRSLASAFDYFYNHPYPPLRTTLKWYEHVTFSHLMPQLVMLKRKGLSLAAMSSKYLEALNKITKRILRSLPGGGRSRAGEDANPTVRHPMFQAFVKLSALLRWHRQALYKGHAEGLGK